MHTYMDHLRLREQEREQREQREQKEEREGEGESESTVDRLVCLAADDSFADDSASAASTTQLFVTILALVTSLVRGLRSHVPCCWSRKVRSSKRRTAQWQSTQLFTDGLAIGMNYRHPRQHRSRCTRALMTRRPLGRSRWLNGLRVCRCLHSGCTDGTEWT